jgi:putative sigma-54 modulation protein
MNVNITARHLELTPALREYVEKRLSQVNKYTDRITSGHVVLNVEKDRHIAEVTVAVSQNSLSAKATAGDMYAAMDLVMDKIVKQLKKHIDKWKEHKVNMSQVVLETAPGETKKGSEKAQYEISEVKELTIKTQSITEALKTLEDRNFSFWVFKDSKDESLSIVYKKANEGKHGLLIVK